MIIGIIPDVHQTIHYVDMIKNNIDYVDKIVFLGDYVDNWDSDKFWNTKEHNPINVIKNIINYKKIYFNKIDLLLGNHCLAYLTKNIKNQNISGHQFLHAQEIKETLLSNKSFFKIAVEYDGWVFSHAGFSNTWVNNQKIRGWNSEKESIIDWCNRMIVEENFHYFDWTGIVVSNGDEITQTPTWIRPFSLVKDPYFNKQIVGHSEAQISPIFVENEKIKLVLVDSPQHTNYLNFDTNNIQNFLSVKEVLLKLQNKI